MFIHASSLSDVSSNYFTNTNTVLGLVLILLRYLLNIVFLVDLGQYIWVMSICSFHTLQTTLSIVTSFLCINLIWEILTGYNIYARIQISINLWATAGGILSSCSLLILRDVASIYNLDCFDTCLSKSYKAFISHYKSVEPTNLRHMQFLRNSIVELCSLDVQRSINIAMVSIHQLAKIMQQAVRTKNKVCSGHVSSIWFCYQRILWRRKVWKFTLYNITVRKIFWILDETVPVIFYVGVYCRF